MSNMPIHPKYAKTCTITLYTFTIIVMKRICNSLSMSFDLAKKKKHEKARTYKP